MFVNRLTLWVWAVALCGLLPLAAQAQVSAAEQGLQSLAGVRATAEKSLRAAIDPTLTGVELEAATLDPRLRLPSCAQKLATQAAPPRNSQSRVLVRVSCATPAWTLNVPVEVRRTHAVLVLRRAVARGEQIVAADVTTQNRVLSGLASPFVARPEDLAGRLTRRPLPEGTALPADALAAVLLIHRGQQVTLLARNEGFEIRAPGRAMADAPAGQRVRVQNLNSLKIVEGLADSEGVVRVLP